MPAHPTLARRLPRPAGFFPPLRWEQRAGTFPSHVRFNFHSFPGAASARAAAAVPDTNGFVSLFVGYALLEVAR
jgi:hypothetical protein